MFRCLPAQELQPPALHHHGCHTQTDSNSTHQRKQRNPHGVPSPTSSVLHSSAANNSRKADPFHRLGGKITPFFLRSPAGRQLKALLEGSAHRNADDRDLTT